MQNLVASDCGWLQHVNIYTVFYCKYIYIYIHSNWRGWSMYYSFGGAFLVCGNKMYAQQMPCIAVPRWWQGAMVGRLFSRWLLDALPSPAVRWTWSEAAKVSPQKIFIWFYMYCIHIYIYICINMLPIYVYIQYTYIYIYIQYQLIGSRKLGNFAILKPADSRGFSAENCPVSFIMAGRDFNREDSLAWFCGVMLWDSGVCWLQ